MGTKAHEASSALIENHGLRFMGGVAVPFQVQNIIQALLQPHGLMGGESPPHDIEIMKA